MVKLHPALEGKLKAAAKFLQDAKASNSHFLIRYHNDADGICSALCISSIPESQTSFPSNSSFYSLSDAEFDSSLLSKSPNSLLILLDFGSSQESLEALKEIKKSGSRILLIDHHPYSEEVASLSDFFLSPLSLSLPQKYVPGFLCSRIAGYAGSKDPSLEKYARIALAGDRSDLLPISREDKAASLVLDWVCTYEEYPKTLEYYRKVLSDQELFSSLSLQAEEKFSEIIQESSAYTRQVSKPPFAFYYVQIDKLMKKAHFPSKAKALTAVFDALCAKEKDLAVVVIGHGESLITFRASPRAVELGFDAGKLIEKTKEETKGSINTAGGHSAAASIRTKKGYGPIVLKEIERLL